MDDTMRTISNKSDLLRVTTRYDNKYTYDVLIESYTAADNTSKYTFKGGYAAEIFEEIIRLYDFRYEFVTEVGTYDFPNATGNLIDVFIGSYGLLESRTQHVDPTFIVGSSKIVAYINHEFENAMKDIYLDLFQPKLLLAMFGMLLLFLTASCIIGYFEKHPLPDAVFSCFASICNKSSNLSYERLSSRIALWMMRISICLLGASYSGNLVSNFAIEKHSISSFAGLVDSHYSILLESGYNQGSAIQQIAESMLNVKVMSKFLCKSKESDFKFESFEQSIAKVSNSPSVYVIDAETGVDAINAQIGYLPCSWGIISVADMKYPWSMYLGKTSCYKSDINTGLLKLAQYGVLKRIHQKWIPRFHGCKKRLSDQFTNLGIEKLHSAFAILIAGCVVAALLFQLLEKLQLCNYATQMLVKTE